MKTILRPLLCSLFLLLAICAEAASPTFQAFRGTNGIVIRTNSLANTVDVDGSLLTNGASAVFVTTNLFVVNNTYTSNLFATNIFVNQNLFVSNIFTTNITVSQNIVVSNVFATNIFVNQDIVVSNLYVTNIFVESIFTTNIFATFITSETINITTNLTVQNIITTNIFVNQSIVTSNIYVTNLFVNSIIGKDILWTNDNGTVRLIDETRVGIGTNSSDALWVLERNTNAINAFNYTTNGVLMTQIDSNGNFYAQGITSGANGFTMLTTNAATTFAYNLDFRKRGTTGNAAAAITQGSELGNVLWKGWDGADYGIGAAIVVKSDEDFAATDYGSHIEFRVVPTNSATGVELMRLQFVNATNGLVTFGGVSAAFPGIRRFGQYLQARLADNSGFAHLQSSNAAFEGNIERIQGATTFWPTANAVGALTNDGAGNFGWNATVGGGGPSPNADLWTNRAASGVIIPSPSYTFRALRTGVRTADSGTPSWDSTNVGMASVSFGSNNQAGAYMSSVLGGAVNLIPTNVPYSTIAGGESSFFQAGSSGGHNFMGGGRGHNIGVAVSNSFFGGGTLALADANLGWVVIVGGADQRVRAQNTFIGGGQGNDARASYSAIVGGLNNVAGDDVGVTDNYCFIGGGSENIASAAYMTIAGGAGNGVATVDGATYGFIGGGRGNQFNSADCVIGGGALNRMENLNDFGFIGGGYTNYISTASDTIGSFIVAGISNRVTAAPLAAVVGQFGTNATPRSILLSPAGTHGSNRVHVTGTATTNIGPLRVSAGNAFVAGTARVGGTISVGTTAVISAGTAETNMITYSVPAHTLTNNGDRLIVRASGRFSTVADAKQLKIVFGSETVVDTGSQTVNGGSWVMQAEIIRTGDTAQTINGFYQGAGVTLFNLANCRDIAQTNGIATLLAVTATCAADGGVTNKSLTVEWHGAP